MKKYAIIGAGVSGLSIARLLKEAGNEVKVYESSSIPGGLIQCSKEAGGILYHRVGGHVFNSKRQDVLDWFWQHFDKGNDFLQASRHAIINLNDDVWVNYPIENHLQELPSDMRESVVEDLLELAPDSSSDALTLGEFFRTRFGKTLNDAYFTPYNAKIWQMDCNQIPLSWLEGKLPMPTVKEILLNNIEKKSEMEMVHSSFYYPKQGGSQFLADTLADGLNICFNSAIDELLFDGEVWEVGGEQFDCVIYTGNIKKLPEMLRCLPSSIPQFTTIQELSEHGTCSVLCSIDTNPYSWIYLPSELLVSHRIICTGNFSSLKGTLQN